ncbi:MAG: rhodanese-like domain-containing protein [Xanthomonadaceae bacterium]|nr:rhodanese-like domain-containing protein [Xanthomonadaceae bacterium]MDP2184266.1 rhodanese-like domain-containing protein [Xanthomonadales bacterium]MDZ4114812.1 rhodanese-like domain-containing protein [Xanthomonadaceae bacterium]MDZ4377401.1 rhodanese-like domain-containing protein [Xanthomonadaceae bacterium]
MPITAKELVAAARQQITEIAPAAVASELAQPAPPAPPVLLDVREPGEFATAHLQGAINIPRGVLEFQVEAHPAMACSTNPALAEREREVLVYCRSGGRAALAAVALQNMGFTQVRSISGGIDAWTAAGLPVVAS